MERACFAVGARERSQLLQETTLICVDVTFVHGLEDGVTHILKTTGW
jgi:hypothetical protein